MVDIKVKKVFFDPDTLQNIYMISFQIDGNYYSIPVNKDQYEKVCIRIKSIYDNNDIEE
jgi:hypothetical protein